MLTMSVESVKMALQPGDRLHVGELVYEGKRAEHVAEQVHLLTIALQNLLIQQNSGARVKMKIRKVKSEIQRCYVLCDRAIRDMS